MAQFGLAPLCRWLKLHLKRGSLALGAHSKSHLIVTGSSHWPLRSPVVLPEVIAGNAMSFLVAQVPDKAVQTRFWLDFLLGFLVVWIERLLRLLNFCS